MKVMIIGCGRVGSVLANRLDEVGHQVVVLDRNQQAFRRLSEKFSGKRIVGNGLVEDYVRPTLQEEANILFAMTDKDNVNLMIAQRVKRNFQLERVVQWFTTQFWQDSIRNWVWRQSVPPTWL